MTSSTPPTSSTSSAPSTSSASPIRLVVITAGLSTPSSTRMLADQLALAVRDRLTGTTAGPRSAAAGRAAAAADGGEAPAADGGSAPEVEIRTIELREIAHEITDMMLTRFPGERMAQAIDAIRASDAVIAVTPIFNVGASGLFKSFVDALDKDLWAGRPVLIGATAGTARHSLAIDFALRPLFAYLHAEVASTAVFAASSDFGAAAAGQADEQPLADRIRRAAGELADLILARRKDLALASAAPREDARRDPDSDPASGPDAGPEEPASTLDPEFADFVPMGTLLKH